MANTSPQYFVKLTKCCRWLVLHGKILGIDVGLMNLAVTSDGAKFANPKHLLLAQKNLARKQQHLSSKGKGSKTYNKARLLVANAHEGLANARKDYLHKLSTRQINENQVIAVEDLHVKGMMKNHYLARAIGDAGWRHSPICSSTKRLEQVRATLKSIASLPVPKPVHVVCMDKYKGLWMLESGLAINVAPGMIETSMPL